MERIVVGGQSLRAEAALAVFERLTEQDGDAIFAERFEHIDAAAGEQRRDDFKRRILSCRADEADDAALDVGQKGVLLGLVEAVNLVDEEDGAGVHLRGLRGGRHHLLDLLDAAHDGGELDEAGLRGFSNDFGESGFAYAGRTPEDHGAGVVALNLHAEGFAGAEQVFLAAVFLEGARTHAFR